MYLVTSLTSIANSIMMDTDMFRLKRIKKRFNKNDNWNLLRSLANKCDQALYE